MLLNQPIDVLEEATSVCLTDADGMAEWLTRSAYYCRLALTALTSLERKVPASFLKADNFEKVATAAFLLG